MTNLENILPFAQAFATQGARNTIPNTGADVANIAQGFPPIFSKPISSGGKYVQRKDMNGIFYLITRFLTYLQNGGVMTFDANVSSLIGGYPIDAVLSVRDNSGVYVRVKSMVPNNVWNPDAVTGNSNYRDNKTDTSGNINNTSGIVRWRTIEYDVSYLYGRKRPSLTYLAGTEANDKTLGYTVNLTDSWRNYDRLAIIMRCNPCGCVNNTYDYIDVHDIFDVWWLDYLLTRPKATDVFLYSGARSKISIKVKNTTDTVIRFNGSPPTSIIGIKYGV